MKRFRGIYWSQFTLTAGMVLLTLLLLGTSFFTLSYTYLMSEKQQELEEKAQMVADLTHTYASDGIRVNCVCPGVINTPLVPEAEKENYRKLHPMHRIGEDFEIASIITFLCSDNARFITGAAIPVDGGYTSL